MDETPPDRKKILSEEEVSKIADLARLAVTPEETLQFARQLSEIFEYVQKLMAVDVDGVEPLSHVHGVTNVFRDDLPSPSLDTDRALKNAPESCGRAFKVPLIIE